MTDDDGFAWVGEAVGDPFSGGGPDTSSDRGGGLLGGGHRDPEGWRSGGESSIPNEVMDRAAEDVIAFAEELTTINGERVDYSDSSLYRFWREPLEAVADPDTEREHVWLMGRGVGKTEQSAIPELHYVTTNPMVDALRGFPRSDQLNSYMNRTLARKVETSRGDPPVLKALLADGSVAVKRNKWLTGSFLEGRSAWGEGRSIQGFHGPYGTADEVQDWTPAALANLKEAIDTPPRRVLLTGTPDYEGTVYAEHWDESTKHEWHYDCPGCGDAQVMDESNVELVSTDPREWEFCCRYCSERLHKDDILLDGYWRATNPGAPHRGYRQTQLLSPRHDLTETMRAKALATTTKADWERYKMARFYSGGAKPISDAGLNAVLDDTLRMADARTVNRPHYVGIDWGGGEQASTVASAVTVHDYDADGWPSDVVVRGVEQVEYESRTEELRKSADFIARFGGATDGRTVADLGYGTAHVDAMQNGDTRGNAIPSRGWGSSVLGHRFGTVSRDTGSGYPYLKRDARRLHAYQPAWANRVCELFPDVQGYDDPPDPGELEVEYETARTTDARITIPYADDLHTRETVGWFRDHLTSIKREFHETQSGNKSERFTTFTDSQRDDGFYSLLYAYTAACIGATGSRNRRRGSGVGGAVR